MVEKEMNKLRVHCWGVIWENRHDGRYVKVHPITDEPTRLDVTPSGFVAAAPGARVAVGDRGQVLEIWNEEAPHAGE
jgi:hypothetical protein